jgi:hypothetical protein
VAQYGKTPSGGGAHRRGGRGGSGLEFAEEPAGAAVFDVSVDLTSSGWRGGVSRAGEWERKVGGGEKGAMTVLIRFHAEAERRREKSGEPGFVHVQVEEKEGGGVTREQRSQAGGGANAPHEHMAADRGGGGGCQVEPLNSPRGAVQPGLNLIQISNEFKLF